MATIGKDEGVGSAVGPPSSADGPTVGRQLWVGVWGRRKPVVGSCSLSFRGHFRMRLFAFED